ncbi:hypothetical protein [Anatilimnocola floriformis]|uniref:hypothetical protein n=1 Tax=Anatilimnocola floriformis TaxID=2948575 RepID=UPI0020C55BA0|nr:hypothetical protein [Anatilimnocola floriformis]
MFRVLITTASGMVRGMSNSVDHVQATTFANFMRGRGHGAQVIEETSELVERYEMLAARQPKTMTVVTIETSSPAVQLGPTPRDSRKVARHVGTGRSTLN